MMKSRKILLLLTFAACCESPAIEGEVRANIRILALSGAAPALTLPGGFKQSAITLVPETRSAPLSYKGSPDLVLEEQPPGKRVYSADLRGSNSSELLIVLGPGEETAQAMVLEDSSAGFPAGSILLGNLAALTAKFSLGHEEVLLASGESRVLRLPAERPAVMVRVSSADGADLLYSNNWAVQPGSRSLLLLLPPDEGTQGRPRTWRLSENIPGS